MLLKHRSPGIDAKSVQPRTGLEHLDRRSIAVVRWLNANHVDYVLVGPVAHAIRGDQAASGPVAIVPAPYSRNWDRLTRALVSEHAGLRSDRGVAERGDSVTVKLTPDKLARGRRWMLRFGEFDLDIEGSGSRAGGARAAGQPRSGGDAAHPPRAPRYQELLYEAHRFEIAEGINVEVASLEDLEHFSHVRRTGVAPEFRVTRSAPAEAAAEAAGTPDDGAADGIADAPEKPSQT